MLPVDLCASALSGPLGPKPLDLHLISDVMYMRLLVLSFQRDHTIQSLLPEPT